MKSEKAMNMRQPMKASMLPGKIKGNMEASKASDMAKSKLPGAGFVSMEAGADPNMKMMLDNGPKGDADHAQMDSPGGLAKRTVTSCDESPYHVS